MTEADSWHRVCNADDLAEDGRLAARVNGRPILLIKRLGQVYALENHCPHLGCALTRGALEGFLLRCPCHDWRFDIRTGTFEYAPEIALPTYPVKIEEDTIYIRIEETK